VQRLTFLTIVEVNFLPIPQFCSSCIDVPNAILLGESSEYDVIIYIWKSTSSCAGFLVTIGESNVMTGSKSGLSFLYRNIHCATIVWNSLLMSLIIHFEQIFIWQIVWQMIPQGIGLPNCWHSLLNWLIFFLAMWNLVSLLTLCYFYIFRTSSIPLGSSWLDSKALKCHVTVCFLCTTLFAMEGSYDLIWIQFFLNPFCVSCRTMVLLIMFHTKLAFSNTSHVPHCRYAPQWPGLCVKDELVVKAWSTYANKSLVHCLLIL
jgi:hypothetical protein